MLSLLLNREDLLSIKKEIQEDALDCENYDELELKDKKRNRVLIVGFCLYFAFSTILLLLFPFATNQEFLMSAYTQIPFTR